MPRCRLCGEEKEKLCKAHILPEAFFRAIKLDGEPLLSIPGTEKHPYTQTHIGRWDDGILCASCDGEILGRLDGIAARVFLQQEFNVHWRQSPEGTHFRMKGVDAGQLKLFWVSVLWRHAISGLPEHEDVALSDEHIERMRQMILRGAPGTADEYSVGMVFFGGPEVIMGLSKSMFGDGWFEIFVSGWHVFVKGGSQSSNPVFRPMFLDSGTDPLVVVKDMNDTPKLWKVLADFVQLDKNEANRAYANFLREQSLRAQKGAGDGFIPDAGATT